MVWVTGTVLQRALGPPRQRAKATATRIALGFRRFMRGSFTQVRSVHDGNGKPRTGGLAGRAREAPFWRGGQASGVDRA